MKRIDAARAAAVLVSLSLGAAPARAHDELYYSAANCVPIHASHWQGNGSQGFEFTNVGTWNNYDTQNYQILVCPVPYFRDTGNLAPIVAKVVVDDYNVTYFTRAYLCGRASSAGNQTCVSDDNFPTAYGNSTIELSLTPTSATRFVWLEIQIPPDAEDNNPYGVEGVSGLVGYRILRN